MAEFRSLNGDVVSVFEKELELCRLTSDELLVIVSDDLSRPQYTAAFAAAGRKIGASVANLRLSALTTGGDVLQQQGGRFSELLECADLIVSTAPLTHSPEVVELQRLGKRILICVEPLDVLMRLFPTEELRRKTENAAALLASAEILRFKNEIGTDVRYALGRYPVVTQHGFAGDTGRFDEWGSAGMLATAGHDDGVDGQVVIAPGDGMLGPFKIYVSSPIYITIEAGRITQVGGGMEAVLFRDHLASFDDEDAYGISHIGWGLDARSLWSSLLTSRGSFGMELKVFSGGVLFSTGPNQPFGGPNKTRCHVDFPMRRCDLWLDDVPIIHCGELTHAELV